MPSLAKHNYVSCLMQITLPEIDNYTLYYETFVFILRVYVIMLFDYVYRCTQSSARAICTLENNYKPANERYAKRGKVEKEKKRRRYPGTCAFAYLSGRPSGDYYNVITTREDRHRTIPEAESNQKLIRARLCGFSLKTASY